MSKKHNIPFPALLGATTLLFAAAAYAEEARDPDEKDAAREALQQREGDVTSEENLEQVFQATEKQYSLLRAGAMSLYFSGDYSYYRNDAIDIAVGESGISRFQIENDAQHSFGASLSFDYGVKDNITFNTRVPVQYKYDTRRSNQEPMLGDISFGLRWQPFSVRPGATNTTFYSTLSTATGDSPYEINPSKDLSGGKGYYSLGFGASFSKIIDPVVLFASTGYTYAFKATGLNQRRGQSNRVLKRVEAGDSINFSMGLAYSLSYEVSVSASYQQSYNFASKFYFVRGGDKEVGESPDSTSSIINTSLGLRTPKNRIVNVSMGFGLTEDSPDVILGVSMPIDISGLKPGA